MRSSAQAGVSHCEANIIRGSRCGLETLFFEITFYGMKEDDKMQICEEENEHKI